MTTVETYVSPSGIHGLGLHAGRDIQPGHVVWRFMPPDSRIPLSEADDVLKHYGYVNPANPAWLVICGDDSRYWNFASEPNCRESDTITNGEAEIVATRFIAAGEELTISFTSDADAARKLGWKKAITQ